MNEYINPDKAAHAIFDFRPAKTVDFEDFRYAVYYCEHRLYAVRDRKKETLTLVEAADPEAAYLKCKDNTTVNQYGKNATNIEGSVVTINL